MHCIEPAAPKPFGALVVDCWTHEQDVRNAVGRQGFRETAGLSAALNAAWAMKRKLRDAGLAPLRFEAIGIVDWVIGDGDPGAAVSGDAYEMARALLGRRSPQQVAAFAWVGDPGPYLPHFGFFPLRDTDLIE